MPRIVIVRHGNTFDKGDVVTRVGARTDLPLSTSGQVQAKRLAEVFSDKLFRRAFCSPLIRTKQTAKIILKNSKLTPTVLPFLTEIDYGPDENKPESDVIARVGQDAIDRWDSDAVPPSGWEVDPAELKTNWLDFFASQASEPGDSLLVTSNGIARFALDVAPSKKMFPRKLRTGAYGVVEYSDGFPRIIDWDVRPEA